jgi:exopolysaccharide biosynthesis polyprenyl glycosylphosphotransferase
VADILPKLSYRVIDQIITLGSFILAYFMANSLAGDPFLFFGWEFTMGGLRSLDEFLLILFVIPFIWWVALNRVSLYHPNTIRSPKLLLWSLIKAHLGGGIVLTGFFFLSKLYFPGRAQIVFFLGINILLLYLEKRLIVYFWKVNKKEKNLQRILLIGSGPEMRRFVMFLESYPEMGYKVVGCLGDDLEDSEETGRSLKVLGSIQEIEKVVRENPIEEVIVFSPRMVWETMEVIGPVCEDMGIRLTLVPQWPSLRISQVSFRKLGPTPLVSFVINPKGDVSLFIKTVTDFMLALLALGLFSPLFIVIAILIKWDSKGPVFFYQKRSGLNGREFSLIKFRSMVKDAEKMQEKLKDFNEMSGPVFKMTADPRVTRIGFWLRKTSLDELPQLINVLKGDLSLVGPRPPLPSEVALYERWQRRRLSVKPGITCTWQISGRNDINFEEWIQLDLHYIDHWSLSLDWKILIRTIPAVLSGRGAK